MELINNGQVDVNKLYVGIKSTNMFFVEFGDSDIVDEYALFEKTDYSVGVEGKKKFDVYIDLLDGNKILINDEKTLSPVGNVDVKVVGLIRLVDLLKVHYNQIRKSRRFRLCIQLYKYLEKCNKEGIAPIVDMDNDNIFFKALCMSDEVYYLSYGYPIEAINFFESIYKQKSLNFEFKDNRVVTKARSRKKDENKKL